LIEIRGGIEETLKFNCQLEAKLKKSEIKAHNEKASKSEVKIEVFQGQIA
jgi:hypothetical protein